MINSRRNQYIKAVIETPWEVKKIKKSVFIVCGSITVAQCLECVAEKIVENHNKEINQ